MASFSVDAMVRAFEQQRHHRRSEGTVSLTTGRGPLSATPAGRFSQAVPAGLVLRGTVPAPCPRRRRGTVVLDSERVLLVHRPAQPPAYAFPSSDVHGSPREAEPEAAGYVRVAVGRRSTRGTRRRSRSSCTPGIRTIGSTASRTNRRLRVASGDVVIVDTTETIGVYETCLAPRLYVAREQVLRISSRPSATTTYCPYKGTASYWSAVRRRTGRARRRLVLRGPSPREHCDSRAARLRPRTGIGPAGSAPGRPRLGLERRAMEETEELRAARAMRRAMLGDAYVDGMTADSDPVANEFQDYLTSMAWGVWARGGALSSRDRSLLVMAMTAALGRMEEFALHASSSVQTGVSDEEMDELLFQIAAYCGAPAALAARRGIRAVRAARTAP